MTTPYQERRREQSIPNRVWDVLQKFEPYAFILDDVIVRKAGLRDVNSVYGAIDELRTQGHSILKIDSSNGYVRVADPEIPCDFIPNGFRPREFVLSDMYAAQAVDIVLKSMRRVQITTPQLAIPYVTNTLYKDFCFFARNMHTYISENDFAQAIDRTPETAHQRIYNLQRYLETEYRNLLIMENFRGSSHYRITSRK